MENIPAKGFVSGNFAGHITSHITSAIFELLRRNPLWSLSRCEEQQVLKHTSAIPVPLYSRDLSKKVEEDVPLVFIIKFYLQTTIYIRLAKFNGRYLVPLSHDRSFSLINRI